jgi:hypothetical protein
LSITPKFGNFNLNPNLNFGANNYFRKVIKSFNSTDSTVNEEFLRGFFTEYNYSAGIGVSTRLYGMADSRRHIFWLIDPNSFGVKAIRHTYQPSVNFNYTPDFSTDKHSFYGTFFNERTQREEKYSFFEKEGGTHASSSLQKRLSYSDMHSFEIKKQGKDTLPDVNMELLRVTLSLSHNFAADSMNFSDISATFRTPFLKALDISGNANFTLYDENKNEHNNYVRVNQFLLSNNKGLVRLTNIGFNLSTSYSSDGFSSPSFELNRQMGGTNNDDDLVVEEENVDTNISLGSRFQRRYNVAEDGTDEIF